MKVIHEIGKAFVAQPPEYYRVKIGKHVASGASAFVAGMAVASILWFAAYYIRYWL